MNEQALLEVKQQILDYPENFDMALYVSVCGTVCCIAGRLVLNAGWATEPNPLYVTHEMIPGVERTIESVATEILDCSVPAEELFFIPSWPYDLQALYFNSGCEGRALAAAERIDRFIAENRDKESAFEKHILEACGVA